MRLLVCGAAGFIGSAYVRAVLATRPDDRLVVLDKLTYAGRLENLADVRDRLDFVEGGIEDRAVVSEVMECPVPSRLVVLSTSRGVFIKWLGA